MCGICGVVLFHAEETVDTDRLRRMTEILRHRGPDSGGFHLAPGIGLGVRRLSIIDLDTGDQPIANEDGTITLVCNGEIYNYRELRHELEAAGHRFRTGSDVEVIVHLYEDLGAGCLSRLRGMFALALWDERHRQLLLARDRLGIKSMDYAWGRDGFYFASESKSILVADSVERELDPQAMRDLFTLGFVQGARTLFTRIRRLLPGHYLIYHQGSLALREYWDVRFPDADDEQPRMSADAWAEALREKIAESVRLHLRSDVPVGAWLSGGVDSSVVTALMGQLCGGPVPTFSVAFEDPAFDEVRRTRTLADFPGYDLPNRHVVCGERDLELFPKVVWHCEDPTTTAVEIPRLLVSELSSRSVKTLLAGEGADEVFGGYWYFRLNKLLRPLSLLPLSLRRLLVAGPASRRWPFASRLLAAPRAMNGERYARMVGPLHGELAQQLLTADLQHRLEMAELEMAGPQEFLPAGRFRGWNSFQQLQYWELKTKLPDFILHKLDRISMAQSLEVRVPFLDHEVVEFSARIPVSLKMRWLQEKHVLRRAFRGWLPDEILMRRKRGLNAPRHAWLRGPLPAFAVEALSPERVRQAGFFRPATVERLLSEHRAGRAQYGDLLVAVLWLQLWDELLLRGCRSSATAASATP
jgi:asparagine synthase (glutamine-hydrolysing)